MKAEILIGDVRSRLSELPDKSVQCCVTSPPYWGLRDYGTASWEGGNNDCDHKIGIFEYSVSGKQASNSASAGHQAHDVCPKCGARRIDSQIGLEQTPQEYITEMVGVFREVHRVLADDGVLWLNIGDSYAGSGKGPAGNLGAKHNERHMEHKHSAIVPDGLKPKDLVGIPWRLAFALQEDGWYLRQDIVWAKPNPMPESVRDRCTKSHEYIFMLTKSSKYYFDNEAIKEPSAQLGKTKIRFGVSKYGDNEDPKHATKSGNEYTDTGKRNKRDVWTVPTKPFKGAHFAVMPEAIVEPCILASSRPGDLILDPFTGSGTVAVVALRHDRNFIGTELNPEYANIANNRITEQFGGLLNDVLLR